MPYVYDEILEDTLIELREELASLEVQLDLAIEDDHSADDINYIRRDIDYVCEELDRLESKLYG